MEFINKNIKWIGLSGCILIILSLFLTFITVTAEAYGVSHSASVSFIEGDGKIVLCAVIIAVVLMFCKKEKISLSFLGMCLGIGVLASINSKTETYEFSSSVSLELSYGVGFYLFYLGIIIAMGSIIYSGFISKNKKANVNYQPQMNQNVQPVQNTFIQPEPTVNQPDQNVQSIRNTFIQPEPMINQNVQQQTSFLNQNSSCPVCGSIVSNDMQFCTQCGNKLRV